MTRFMNVDATAWMNADGDCLEANSNGDNVDLTLNGDLVMVCRPEKVEEWVRLHFPVETV